MSGIVVYLLIPTSNHNQSSLFAAQRGLYIFWFLHQTTTSLHKISLYLSCISFDSYIKPQPVMLLVVGSCVVYLLIPTSNHNGRAFIRTSDIVVYLLIPTSNHNWRVPVSCTVPVVYLLIPTSNHNIFVTLLTTSMLYIFWFLHQTTTMLCNGKADDMLYIFWFLHQTTTMDRTHTKRMSCISFDSYIKPQLIRITTSLEHSCISFDSYIKPQPSLCNVDYITVVYLLIPTSNHNL